MGTSSLYPNVSAAKAVGDKPWLSVLGKKGAESKKRKKEWMRTLRLIGSAEMRHEANEDICPVGD